MSKRVKKKTAAKASAAKKPAAKKSTAKRAGKPAANKKAQKSAAKQESVSTRPLGKRAAWRAGRRGEVDAVMAGLLAGEGVEFVALEQLKPRFFVGPHDRRPEQQEQIRV